MIQSLIATLLGGSYALLVFPVVVLGFVYASLVTAFRVGMSYQAEFVEWGSKGLTR